MDRLKDRSRRRTVARNYATGTRAEDQNQRLLGYMKNFEIKRQNGKAKAGTRLDFSLHDKKGNLVVVQELKTGAIRGTKGLKQIRLQLELVNDNKQHNAKYVLLYPGGFQGFKSAKNVSHRVKKLMYRAIGSGQAVIKDLNKQFGYVPLIKSIGGEKVKTLMASEAAPRTTQHAPAVPKQRHARANSSASAGRSSHNALQRFSKTARKPASKPNAPRHARPKPPGRASTNSETAPSAKSRGASPQRISPSPAKSAPHRQMPSNPMKPSSTAPSPSVGVATKSISPAAASPTASSMLGGSFKTR